MPAAKRKRADTTLEQSRLSAPIPLTKEQIIVAVVRLSQTRSRQLLFELACKDPDLAQYIVKASEIPEPIPTPERSERTIDPLTNVGPAIAQVDMEEESDTDSGWSSNGDDEIEAINEVEISEASEAHDYDGILEQYTKNFEELVGPVAREDSIDLKLYVLESIRDLAHELFNHMRFKTDELLRLEDYWRIDDFVDRILSLMTYKERVRLRSSHKVVVMHLSHFAEESLTRHKILLSNVGRQRTVTK